MESKMFRKLKIHLFLQSCIPSVFRHLWNLFAYRIWQSLVPWKYFFPMQLTESLDGYRQHWSKPFFFSGALTSLQNIGNFTFVLNTRIIKPSVSLSARTQQELLILEKNKNKTMLFPTLSTLKILTFLPVCFSFSACGDNKNDSDAMKECSLACSDLRPEDKSDKITPEVISSRLHQSFLKKYFISFNYILCLNLTGVWSPSSYHCFQHLQLHQMEVYHLARRLNFLCMTQTTTFSLLPQYFPLQSVAHPTGQHHWALLWLMLRVFYPPMRLAHNVSTGYISTLSYVIIPFFFWLFTSQVKSLPHSLLEGASYTPPSWKTSSR